MAKRKKKAKKKKAEERVLTKGKSKIPPFTFWIIDFDHEEADPKTGKVDMPYDVLKVSNELMVRGFYENAIGPEGEWLFEKDKQGNDTGARKQWFGGKEEFFEQASMEEKGRMNIKLDDAGREIFGFDEEWTNEQVIQIWLWYFSFIKLYEKQINSAFHVEKKKPRKKFASCLNSRK